MDEYLIWIDNTPVPVCRDVYKEYWRGRRKERYFTESDIHNNVLYYDALDTDETIGCEMFCDENTLPVDELAITNLEIDKLYTALEQLKPNDYELIYSFYFAQMTFRDVSQQTGIPISTLHGRLRKILQKLRELMTCKKAS